MPVRSRSGGGRIGGSPSLPGDSARSAGPPVE